MLGLQDARILELINIFLMYAVCSVSTVCCFDNRDLPNTHALRAPASKVSDRGAIFMLPPTFRHLHWGRFQFSGSVARSTACSIPKQRVYLAPLMHAGCHTPLLKMRKTYPLSPVDPGSINWALQVLCRKR